MAEYRLTLDAEDDLWEIARYTLTKWGETQQRRYETALLSCFEQLASKVAFARCPLPHRPDIRQVRCGHHIVFAMDEPGAPTTIIAVLHENMDLMRRLRARLEGE
jgi:toxin ParE1/3/4